MRYSSSRIQGLDGLRAVAIIAVLFFHSDFSWARGGFLGVDLFFVLSGFLITGLLADESATHGRISLTGFYWRRAKRLLPAVWLMIGCTALVAAWIASDALPRLRMDALASVFYVTNWELLWSNTSYFEASGRQPLLMHLWSLSIEEQFYLVWAIVVALGIRPLRRLGLAIVAIGLAAASAWWMWTLGHDEGNADGNVTRLYFGTDTHGFPLLIGAMLGLLWKPAGARSDLATGWKIVGTTAGVSALATLVFLFGWLGEQDPDLYPWGFLVTAGTCAALIVLATHPGLLLGRWLDCAPLRWIGDRSYGIYLWHWPIAMLLRPGIDFREVDPTIMIALRLLLPIVIAAISYRLVEMPIRGGAIERAWKKLRDPFSDFSSGVISTLAVLASIGFITIAAAVLWHSPAQDKPAADVAALFNGVETTEQAPPAATTQPAATPIVVPAPAQEDIEQAGLEDLTGSNITAVGDSVLLGSRGILSASLKGMDLHATVGWQAADILHELETLKAKKQLRQAVLLHLGTNGYVYEGQLRAILKLLADRKRVVLVDSNVPRRWMDFNNKLIERVTPEFANVIVVHWSHISDRQPDFFVSDGVHLTVPGQRALIAGIMKTGHLRAEKTPKPKTEGDDLRVADSGASGDLSPTLALVPQEKAPDAFWLRLARCVSDSQWENTGEYAGGLAISASEWLNYGGGEFAREASTASREQQIEIANRIATQGWTSPSGAHAKPVGYARWRCTVAIHPPKPPKLNGLTLTFMPESVLAQTYHLGQRGLAVRDLQTILGLPIDGIYAEKDQRKFLAYLKSHALPESRAGAGASDAELEPAAAKASPQ